ncbi:unnamed protein product, partial [Iphiclides podalirius]
MSTFSSTGYAGLAALCEFREEVGDRSPQRRHVYGPCAEFQAGQLVSSNGHHQHPRKTVPIGPTALALLFHLYGLVHYRDVCVCSPQWPAVRAIASRHATGARRDARTSAINGQHAGADTSALIDNFGGVRLSTVKRKVSSITRLVPSDWKKMTLHLAAAPART